MGQQQPHSSLPHFTQRLVTLLHSIRKEPKTKKNPMHKRLQTSGEGDTTLMLFYCHKLPKLQRFMFALSGFQGFLRGPDWKWQLFFVLISISSAPPRSAKLLLAAGYFCSNSNVQYQSKPHHHAGGPGIVGCTINRLSLICQRNFYYLTLGHIVGGGSQVIVSESASSKCNKRTFTDCFLLLLLLHLNDVLSHVDCSININQEYFCEGQSTS